MFAQCKLLCLNVLARSCVLDRVPVRGVIGLGRAVTLFQLEGPPPRLLKRMSYILAIQPDVEQARVLRDALDHVVEGLVVVVDSTEQALNAIDKEVPDLVLLHALISPGEDEHLAACLRALPDAHHVQAIRIPHFERPSDRPPPKWGLGLLKPRANPVLMAGCDPQLFATDVLGYLSNARQLRQQVKERRLDDVQPASNRRRARRWSPREVPWVSSVRLAAGERTELIDISAGGALLRSYERPQLQSLTDRGQDSGTGPGLTLHLRSGEQVRLAGRVIRCQAGSFGEGTTKYEVALQFDESVDLYLPTVSSHPREGDDRWSVALEVPPQMLAVVDQWCQW